MSFANSWENSRVLVTGVCGTVGREILHQLRDRSPADIVGLDNNETELFFLMEEYRDDPRVNLFVADVRDRDELTRRMRHIDVVLHTAALKHVILSERSPRDVIRTNILGVENVIDAANANTVSHVLFTSSDKAVNPTSVMGTSKLMGERLMTAADATRRSNAPLFASTRFGNVLGSRGSVIPLFKRQIASGGPVTLTDERMTRFIMSIEEAVRLVLDSVFLASGGEVFVTKMPTVRIPDLAQVMIEELSPRFGYRPHDIHVRVIGTKAGEKLYEELMNEEETRRALELDRYFVVMPPFAGKVARSRNSYPPVIADRLTTPYNSTVQAPMSVEQLRTFLLSNRLLEVAAGEGAPP